MIQDLHAHTYYSFCSNDRPETVIETAIAGGIQQLGICDHNYGVGCARTEFCWDKGTRLNADYEKTLVRYYDHIKALNFRVSHHSNSSTDNRAHLLRGSLC